MTTIEAHCCKCGDPMTLEIDTEWMSAESARKVATCSPCMRRMGLRVSRDVQPKSKQQREFKLPYKD